MRNNLLLGIASVVGLMLTLAFLTINSEAKKLVPMINEDHPIAACDPFPECLEYPKKYELVNADEFFKPINELKEEILQSKKQQKKG